MFNLVNRVQNSFGYFTTVLSVFAAVVSVVSVAQLHLSGAFNLSSNIDSITPRGSLSYSSRIKATVEKPKELCKVSFDLNAGKLSSIYTVVQNG